MKLEWRTEKRKVKDLKLFEGNPRQMSEKQAENLLTSLRKFNLVEIPAIDQKNRVIAGNMRVVALQKLGRENEEIPVRVPSRPLTEEEAREYLIRSNKNIGSWDYDLLANWDESLLTDAGFTDDELDQVFNLEYTDDFDTEKELEKILKGGKRRCKAGDVWQLGEHRLIIGNSTDRKVWEKLMEKDKWDFLFTDPPYALKYTKKNVHRIKTKSGFKLQKFRIYDSIGETAEKGKKKGFGAKQNRLYEGVEMGGGVPEYDEWLSLAHEFENPRGVNAMIFESWKNTRELWNAMEKYWKIRNMVIWHLPNRHQGFSAPHQLFSKYDIAMLGDRGKAPVQEGYEEELETYLKDKGQKLLDSYEIILYAQKGKEATWQKPKGTKWAKIADHITWGPTSGPTIVFGRKPLQILVPYVKILCPRDGIVAEPFGGSGSTIIASEIMKRKARCIELSPTYSEVILNRYEKFTGNTARKEKG